MDGKKVEGDCFIGDHTGLAGHCLLTYPSGGKLLTSCGHWIELVKLDITNEDIIFRVAEEEYGKEYSNNMMKEYKGMNEEM